MQQSGGGCIGGGVEQVELVVDALVAALFVANECEGVAGAGEEVQFAEVHFFFFVKVDGGADDREEGVSVAFELGALVAAGGVFDGEFVQVEGFLQGV